MTNLFFRIQYVPLFLSIYLEYYWLNWCENRVCIFTKMLNLIAVRLMWLPARRVERELFRPINSMAPIQFARNVQRASVERLHRIIRPDPNMHRKLCGSKGKLQTSRRTGQLASQSELLCLRLPLVDMCGICR